MKKRCFPILSALLLWCMFFAGAYARADAGMNSERYGAGESLVVWGEDVYCLTDGAFFSDAVIWKVTDGEKEKVHSAREISDLSAYSNGIMYTRTVNTLGSLLDHTITGNQFVETLNPDTGEVTPWFSFESDDVLLRRAFARESNVYMWNEADGQTVLERLTAHDWETVFETEQIPYEWPTFCLMDVQAGLMDKSKVKLTIFDTRTQQKYTTEQALNLPYRYDDWDALQAVLDGEKLYYLAKDGLRVYDFSSHTEELMISMDIMPVRSFTMSEEYLVFYGRDGAWVEVYDAQTREYIRDFSTSVWNGKCVLLNGKMYFYTPYGDGRMEIWDIESGEKSVVKLSESISDVTWVD